MSDNISQQEPGAMPEGGGQAPPQGFYAYPGMNPAFNPAMSFPYAMTPQTMPGMASVPPIHDPAQHYAHMQVMAMQYAQLMQERAMMAAAAQQGMMPPQAGMATPESQPHQEVPAQENPFENNRFLQQAQSMLEGAMGEEEAGMFKELLGGIGMDDKDFWKGALVGAAAALILSNENVRKNIMGMVSGAGDMLKSGGASVKDTASSVKENVAAGSNIFRDTYEAGKEGFKESVERHKASAASDDTEATEEDKETKE